MKFVIAVDGSDASLHALTTLIELSRGWAGTHHYALINVQQPIPHADAFGLTAGLDGPLLEQISKRELQPGSDLLQQAGLDFSTRSDVGPAAHCISDYADEVGADMIVLGTKGRSNLANVFVGSVANRVPTQSKRPVLLIPPK